MKERNKSEVKGPADIDVEYLDEVHLDNHNANCIWWKMKMLDSSESSSSSSAESDDDDNDVEDLADYRPDGYHVAHIGEIIDSKYVLLKKLGWGHFSTVWLAFKFSDKQLYALKMQKSAEKYIESAFEEEEILY